MGRYLLKVIKAVGLLAACIVGGLALMLGILVAKDRLDDRAFDQKVWRDSANVYRDNPRAQMYREVVEWLEEEQPSRRQIIARLGPPNSTGSDSRWDGHLSYDLGVTGSFGYDGSSIEIWLDDDKRVSKVSVLQH